MAYNSRKNNPYTGKGPVNLGGPGNPPKKEKPAVTAANTEKFTDYDKKYTATHGVGAKLSPKGTPRRAEQEAVAKAKIEAYKSKHGHYPTERGYPGLGSDQMKGTSGGVLPTKKKK
jgi:hypothetical protein